MSKIVIDEINIECFETEIDLKHFVKENTNVDNMLFTGKLYEIPQELRKENFKNPNELIVDIKRRNYDDVQFVLIHK